MIFQRFLRGVCDTDGSLDSAWLDHVFTYEGLRSAWLRKQPNTDPGLWGDEIDDNQLAAHITRFGSFGSSSPFLSLSAGTVEVNQRLSRNDLYPAWVIALWFATDGATKPGWVFYGYVSVLGRTAMPLLEYSEEARDLHQYNWWNPYHYEGEIVAKMWVPPTRLEGAIYVSAADAVTLASYWPSTEPAGEPLADPLRARPTFEPNTKTYRRPEDFVNLRSAL